jgi:hypothetical protein
VVVVVVRPCSLRLSKEERKTLRGRGKV